MTFYQMNTTKTAIATNPFEFSKFFTSKKYVLASYHAIDKYS